MRLQGTGDFAQEVVGESHYQDNLAAICGERKPDGENRIVEAVLVLDDSNPYDPNAVRVDIKGMTVGYLSKEVAPHFREHMTSLGHRSTSFQCRANIRGGWDRGGGDTGHYGVWLELPRAPAPEKRRRPLGRILLYLLIVLIGGFLACVAFGFLLQALGIA